MLVRLDPAKEDAWMRWQSPVPMATTAIVPAAAVAVLPSISVRPSPSR